MTLSLTSTSSAQNHLNPDMDSMMTLALNTQAKTEVQQEIIDSVMLAEYYNDAEYDDIGLYSLEDSFLPVIKTPAPGFTNVWRKKDSAGKKVLEIENYGDTVFVVWLFSYYGYDFHAINFIFSRDKELNSLLNCENCDGMPEIEFTENKKKIIYWTKQ